MEGRCFITNYTVGPSACTMVTDHCVNGTCFNTTCEPGLCGPLHDDCAEALCVPAREGGFECYPSWIGRCTADYVGYYVGAPADPPAHTPPFATAPLTDDELEARLDAAALPELLLRREEAAAAAARRASGQGETPLRPPPLRWGRRHVD